MLRKIIAEQSRLVRNIYRLRYAFAKLLHPGKVVHEGKYGINVPVRLGGKGSLHFGKNISLGYALAPKSGTGEILIQARTAEARISIGEKTALSNNVSIIATDSISIGKNVLIGNEVMIVDSDFHDIDPIKRHTSAGESKPVVLEDNTWIGSRVMIMKGVVIGENSVIGAGSVVTHSIPSNVVAAGVPAKPIRSLLIDNQ